MKLEFGTIKIIKFYFTQQKIQILNKSLLSKGHWIQIGFRYLIDEQY